MSDETSEFIPTRSSIINKKSVENFKVVSYSSHKKKAKEDQILHKRKENGNNKQSFNMKRARHEIIKFGMSGFNSRRKEEAKVQLAIKLGAKPRRNKCVNYKELLEKKKREKEKAKSISNFQQLGKNQVGKSTAKGKGFNHKTRKQKNNLLDAYGKVKLGKKR